MIALAWVALHVRGFEFGDGEMQVTLGGGERAMAEDLLQVTRFLIRASRAYFSTMPPRVLRAIGRPRCERKSRRLVFFSSSFGRIALMYDSRKEQATAVSGTTRSFAPLPPLTAPILRLPFPMTLASFPELKKLPKRQRFKLAEELWLSGVNDSLPVRSAQKKLLDTRWAAYRAGAAKRIALAELERRLSRK